MSETYRYLRVEPSGEVVKVRLESENVDSENFEDVTHELTQLVEREGHTKIVLNLDSVEYMQSTALGRLVLIDKKVGGQGGKLCLCNLRPSVRELFEITGLDEVLDIRTDEGAAMQAF